MSSAYSRPPQNGSSRPWVYEAAVARVVPLRLCPSGPDGLTLGATDAGPEGEDGSTL